MPQNGLIHASCASFEGLGVLLLGPSGSGKSSLLLRLIDSGFDLVGDDRLNLDGKRVRAISSLAGMIEIRGAGLVRMPYIDSVSLGLCVHLTPGCPPPRLPEERIDAQTGLWQMTLDGFHTDAVAIIRTVLRCIRGDFTLLCGLNGGTTHCLPLPSGREEG